MKDPGSITDILLHGALTSSWNSAQFCGLRLVLEVRFTCVSHGVALLESPMMVSDNPIV